MIPQTNRLGPITANLQLMMMTMRQTLIMTAQFILRRINPILALQNSPRDQFMGILISLSHNMAVMTLPKPVMDLGDLVEIHRRGLITVLQESRIQIGFISCLSLHLYMQSRMSNLSLFTAVENIVHQHYHRGDPGWTHRTITFPQNSEGSLVPELRVC